MTNLEFHQFQDGFSINSTNDEGFSGSIGDTRNLVTISDDVTSVNKNRNIFSFSFYQQYFDVDTNQVLKRLLNSVVPTHNNYILDFVQPAPDLWGPFWISVTLIFFIGIFGNIAQYIENEGGSGEYESDFRLVTSASTLIFIYVVIIPVLISAFLWYRKVEIQYTYPDILCTYGYSLSIFIPVAMLWTFDVNWFRWMLIFVAVSLSGAVLAKTFWAAFKTDPNKMVSLGSVLGVLLLHFLLAFILKEYFFDPVHPRSKIQTIDATSDLSLQNITLNSTVVDVKKSSENQVLPDLHPVLENGNSNPHENSTTLGVENMTLTENNGMSVSRTASSVTLPELTKSIMEPNVKAVVQPDI